MFDVGGFTIRRRYIFNNTELRRKTHDECYEVKFFERDYGWKKSCGWDVRRRGFFGRGLFVKRTRL